LGRLGAVNSSKMHQGADFARGSVLQPFALLGCRNVRRSWQAVNVPLPKILSRRSETGQRVCSNKYQQ
jgi:hypothetical protein